MLVYKSLLCTVKMIKTDPFGRFVILVLIIDNRPYTFVAVYIPPPFTVGLWELIMNAVLQVAEGPMILAENLNAVLSLVMDRYGMVDRGSCPLEACMKPYDLQEVWRWKNPNTKGIFLLLLHVQYPLEIGYVFCI